MDFPFTLAPGQTITVNTRQAYLYYEAGSAGGADASVRVSADIGDEIVLKPGQGFRYSGPFNRLYLSNNKGQAPIIGHIVMEAGEFFDNRVTGSVEIVDGGKNRTLANQTFLAASNNGAVTGTQVPLYEIWNPPGSGKNVVIEQYQMSSLVSSVIYAGWHVVRKGSGTNGIFPKKAGGAFSTSYGTDVVLATPALPGDCKILTTNNVQANIPVTIGLREPIVIPPGCGFFVTNTSQAAPLQTNVEFFEEGV